MVSTCVHRLQNVLIFPISRKVAELACTFCDDLEGIRMVRVSVKYVHTLSPQVNVCMYVCPML